MKKILVYGMSGNPGGIESYLINYYKRIDVHEIHFDFVVCGNKIAYENVIRKRGGKIYYVPSRRENLLLHMRLIRSIAQQGYDAVYFNLLSASEVFSVSAVAGMQNTKIIVHSHNNYVKSIKRHLFLRYFLNKLAEKRLACSKEAAEFMFGKKAKEAVIIRNAIEIEKFLYNPEIRKRMRDKYNLDGKYVLGHVGRLCYQKNTLFLLDVFKRVKREKPNSKLIIIGDGEDRDMVQKQINTLRLDQDVIMAGVVDNVNEWMMAMDVFLLPSRFEGLPVVAVEAQTAGLPCVFSDTFSKDAAITNNVSFLSLDSSLDVWAEKTIKYEDYERKYMFKVITEAGYNIKTEVETLCKVLEG